ncbi:toxin-antitoxin system HicB family antitoxin [Geomonas sp. Red276]
MTESRYSVKFPLRLPKRLHAGLAREAEADSFSLNLYMVALLSEKHTIHKVEKLLATPAITTQRPRPPRPQGAGRSLRHGVKPGVADGLVLR